ncbi:glucosaminidase domain-containing protein [Methylobrevis pamukkalensis]|uniref:glucosaminidase domain-containing protein n=1 Tax=Methylobrevis pamukkalensis TaxID=1439726 RepID=UPI0014709EB8|nr:glucosaminidase domain-containing protein [Methylobrevis pamukkalensis]
MPLFAAEQQHLAMLAEINRAHAIGALNADEMAVAVGRQQAAYAAQVGAINAATGALQRHSAAARADGIASHDLINMQAQFTDLGVQIASGGSPAMAILQQGAQLAPIVSAQGSIREGASALAAGFASMLNPVNLAVIGMAAAAAGASLLFETIGSGTSASAAALERHIDVVRRIKDAYGEAARGVKEYAAEEKIVIDYAAGRNVDDLKKRYLDAAQAIAGEINSHFVDGIILGADQGLEGPLRAYLDAARAGVPDIAALRREIAAIGAASDDPRLKKAADDWLDATTTADELGRAADAAAGNIAKISVESARAADAMERYSRASASLQRRAIPPLDPMAQINADERAAIAAAGGTSEETRARLLAERARQQERARNTPVPRPNERRGEGWNPVGDILRGAEEDQQALAIQAQALRMSGAAAVAYAREQSLLAEARRQNIDLTPKQTQAIREEAAAYAALAGEVAAIAQIEAGRERLEMARAELALVGQSESARARVLALVEAEQRIRRAGIAADSERAGIIREQLAAEADMAVALDRQTAAWDKIRDAGGDAINTLVDGLRTGKFEIEDLATDLTRSLFEVGLANPLKNALLGQNLPTLGDVGGVLGKMMGNEANDNVAAAALDTGTMSVTAATVIINGGVAAGSGAAGLNFAPANSNAAPAPAGGATFGTSRYSGDQAAFLESIRPGVEKASAATGIDPRIIAAQAALESNWGKSAPGNNLFGIKGPGQSLATREVVDGKWVSTTDSFRTYASPADSVAGYADFINRNPRYGAFKSAQGMDAQIDALGRSGYATDPAYGAKIASIAGKLDTFGAALDKPTETLVDFTSALGPVAGAGRAEVPALSLTRAQAEAMPAGVSAYGAKAEDQVSILEGSFDRLSAGIGGIVDQFLPGFGGVLTTLLQGIAQSMQGMGGGGGGLLGSIASAIGAAFGGGVASLSLSAGAVGAMPAGVSAYGTGWSFDGGGYTGPGGRYEPKGIVHAGEVVWNQDDVARHGGPQVVDAMRRGLPGYANGGIVNDNGASWGGWAAAPAPAASGPVTVVVNPARASDNVQVEEEQDERGGRRVIITTEEVIGQAMGRPGSAANRQLGGMGVRAKPRRT